MNAFPLFEILVFLTFYISVKAEGNFFKIRNINNNLIII